MIWTPTGRPSAVKPARTTVASAVSLPLRTARKKLIFSSTVVNDSPCPSVAAKALLDTTLNPTEEEARYWLAGNLCRCTGYDKVLRAVMDAAEVMRAEAGR